MRYEEPSLAPPYLPIEVTDVDLAFPAHGLRLMPKREDMRRDGELLAGPNWELLAADLFMGQAEDLELLPSVFMVENDFEPETAWRHLRCVLGSYEPKQEHKMEAVAFLLHLWFRHASWKRSGSLSPAVRQRYAGSPELPEGYEESSKED